MTRKSTPRKQKSRKKVTGCARHAPIKFPQKCRKKPSIEATKQKKKCVCNFDGEKKKI
jgi:hypothetical protein